MKRVIKMGASSFQILGGRLRWRCRYSPRGFNFFRKTPAGRKGFCSLPLAAPGIRCVRKLPGVERKILPEKIGGNECVCCAKGERPLYGKRGRRQKTGYKLGASGRGGQRFLFFSGENRAKILKGVSGPDARKREKVVQAGGCH